MHLLGELRKSKGLFSLHEEKYMGGGINLRLFQVLKQWCHQEDKLAGKMV